MPRQLHLRPLARRTDPATSKLAADETVRSGRHASHMVQVLRLVRQHPGSTSAELAARADNPTLDRYAAARRTSDLCHLGKIRKGEARECRMTGRASVTWWPA